MSLSKIRFSHSILFHICFQHPFYSCTLQNVLNNHFPTEKWEGSRWENNSGTWRQHNLGEWKQQLSFKVFDWRIIFQSIFPQAAEDVGGSLADKFNDLSSIHFATPQFSYIPTYISEAAVVKTPDLDQVVYQKKSTLENLLNPTKESVRDLIQLKRDAINNIVNPQKTTVEKYVKSRRKKIGDLIEFKKSAIKNLVVPKVFPKREKIEQLIKLKRSKSQDQRSNDQD